MQVKAGLTQGGGNRWGRRMVPRLPLAALVLLPTVLLRAHHSLAAEFDSSKPIVLHGKVTKVAWMNPHVHIWVDVAGAGGKVTNWGWKAPRRTISNVWAGPNR